MTAHPLRDLHWASRLSALQRQAIAVAPAAATAVLGWRGGAAGLLTPLLLGWVVYCAVELALAACLTWRLDARATERRARWNDPGAALLLVIVTLAACASLVAVGMVLHGGHGAPGPGRWELLALVAASVGGAWALIQTACALHYARVYYRSGDGPAPHGGLQFPGGEAPNYQDFLYYAMTVGMTSQTSDVTVLSRRMRRLTMAHGVLSFVFNLVVLALMVSSLSALLQ